MTYCTIGSTDSTVGQKLHIGKQARHYNPGLFGNLASLEGVVNLEDGPGIGVAALFGDCIIADIVGRILLRPTYKLHH